MKKTNVKSEVSKFAKSVAPDIVRLKVIEKDNIVSLLLKWKYFPRTIESSHLICRSYNSDQELPETIANQIRSEVKKAILNFGKQESDFLISKFGLSEVYEDAYKDKNVMYKVKRDHIRKIGRVNVEKNLSFYYFDEIKISLPHLYYFWILLLRKRFNHDNLGAIFDITHSIIERIKQLFFTYNVIQDTIKGAYHFGNPDTAFVFFYHFGYFVSLVKTIGDNLAWLLKLYLRLNISYYDVDINADRFSFNLKSRLRYYDIIYSNDYYEEFKKLTMLRDIFQHRHIIRDIRGLKITNGQNKIVIPKNPEQYISEILKLKVNVSSSQGPAAKLISEDIDSAIRYGLHEYFVLSDNELLNDYEDPLILCRRHIDGISLLTDKIFNGITNETTRTLVGEVAKFYPKNSVAVVNVSNELKIADEILIEGATTSLQQQNTSMEIDYNKVEKCDNGLVGIKVNAKVRAKDKVYKIKKIDNNTFLFGYVYGY